MEASCLRVGERKLNGFGRPSQVRNAFLIRDPAAVLASYAAMRSEVTLADIGIVQQRELQIADAARLHYEALAKYKVR